MNGGACLLRYMGMQQEIKNSGSSVKSDMNPGLALLALIAMAIAFIAVAYWGISYLFEAFSSAPAWLIPTLFIVYWLNARSNKIQAENMMILEDRLNTTAEAARMLSVDQMHADYNEMCDDALRIGADPIEWDDFKERREKTYSKYLSA